MATTSACTHESDETLGRSIEKDLFMSTYFETIWTQVKECLKPVLKKKSSGKSKCLKKFKEKFKKEISKMIAYESIENTLEKVGNDWSSKYKDNTSTNDDTTGTPEEKDDEVEDEVLHQPRKKFKWTIQDDSGRKLSNAKNQIKWLEHVNKQKDQEINILKEKNASLYLRNAQFTKLKIIDQIGQTRSTLMVDASLFTNAFHAGDFLMQQQQSTLLDPANFADIQTTFLCKGSFFKTDLITFSNSGDRVVLKHDFDGFFGVQALAIVSHEHRLLKFVGEHANIVSTIGLVHSSNSFGHVLHFEPGLSLSKSLKYSMTSLVEFKCLIRGIMEGLNFLFDRGVIHNHLVADNIILNGNCPKIIGFAFACRAESAKLNVVDVITKFECQSHFAPELFKSSKVSYSSDVYSFGTLLKIVLKRKITFDLDDALETRLHTISDFCLKKKPGERPAHKFLLNRINSILDAS
ncbi:uncharacterized protein [Clytia hemisphaerica]